MEKSEAIAVENGVGIEKREAVAVENENTGVRERMESEASKVGKKKAAGSVQKKKKKKVPSNGVINAADATSEGAVKGCRVQVSNTKKPLFFYLNVAKRYIKQNNYVELSALGMAIPTVVTISEILKKDGWATEKRIGTSTVTLKDEAKGRVIMKAKIEILLEKHENSEKPKGSAANAPSGTSEKAQSSEKKDSSETDGTLTEKKDTQNTDRILTEGKEVPANDGNLSVKKETSGSNEKMADKENTEVSVGAAGN